MAHTLAKLSNKVSVVNLGVDNFGDYNMKGF